MVNYCVAFGCNNSYKDGVSLFKFPKDPNLREAWVKQVKRTRDKWTGPSQHSVLCCNHFTEDSFEPSPATMGIKKRVVLKAGAIPTIFKRPTTTPVAVPKKRTAHEKLTRSRVRYYLYKPCLNAMKALPLAVYIIYKYYSRW